MKAILLRRALRLKSLLKIFSFFIFIFLNKYILIIPTTTISRTPKGGGTLNEDVNMLSDYRINSFCADGTKDYQLDYLGNFLSLIHKKHRFTNFDEIVDERLDPHADGYCWSIN